MFDAGKAPDRRPPRNLGVAKCTETPAIAEVPAFLSPVELRGFEPLTP
jgi:hypothetical protein